MGALLYFFRGLALIWYALSPSYRQRTNARWKDTRPHRLIAEIGTGIIGLVLVFLLIWFLYDSVFDYLHT